MLIINKTRKEKEYQIPKMPNYEHKMYAIAWLKKQKIEAELANVKSISIQMKDINQMIYSQSFRMVSLHAKCQRNKKHTKLNDEDYLTIHKLKKGNKKESINKDLIYDIITADWIINYEEIEKKSIKELITELQNLETEIEKLNIKLAKSSFNKTDVNNRINLLTYKYNCINDYLSQKQTTDKIKKLAKK